MSVVETVKEVLGFTSEHEAERARQRAEARARIVVVRQAGQQVAATRREATQAEAEIDTAVAQHQAVCTPLQEQLVLVTTEAERAALRAAIDAENEKLERRIKTLRARIQQNMERHYQLIREMSETPETVEAGLIRTASEPLQHAMFVNEQCVLWARMRSEAAQKRLRSGGVLSMRKREIAPQAVAS